MASYLLYLALQRLATPGPEGTHYTALLLHMPAQSPFDHDGVAHESHYLRARNWPDPRSPGNEHWRLEMGAVSSPDRLRVAGLVLLGQCTHTPDALARLLSAVPLPARVDHSVWSTWQWATTAISFLVHNQIMPPPQQDLNSLHSQLLQAADAFWAQRRLRALDTTGRVLPDPKW